MQISPEEFYDLMALLRSINDSVMFLVILGVTALFLAVVTCCSRGK